MAISFAFLGVWAAHAQYGPQLPIPHIGHHSKTASNQSPPLEVEGIVKSNDGRNLTVGSDDGRTFTIALNEKTNYTKDGKSISGSAITAGATVQVEAARDEHDNLTALRVQLLKEAGPEAREAPESAANAISAKGSPDVTGLNTPVDAPDRPILHHGTGRLRTGPVGADNSVDMGSGKSGTSDDGIIMEPDRAASKDAATHQPTATDLITRAKAWVESFTNGLPNYVCQQNTTRYQEESRQEGWRALDLITAQVVYEDGKESYRDITVGGKRTTKSMLELGGTTSTGEFATSLRGLFAPGTQASFKLYRTTRLGQSEAAIYDFKVALRNSDWQINVGGQSLRPAYSGSVWIDKNTAEVRRLEMQADNIPADFPLDTVEWAVDYDKVSLGTNSFFLPVHAENLGCQRGSSICMKNSVDFRNYHRFAGQSTITFDK